LRSDGKVLDLNGRLSLSNEGYNIFDPVPIVNPYLKDIIDICAAGYNSLFLDKNGDVYITGHINPNIFIIDGKIVPPIVFKGHIHNLIYNIVNNVKIDAAPEDENERKAIYKKLHNYVGHIAHIINQRTPQQNSAIFLALGEIGAKCFTQYLELPAQYRSQVHQMDIPMIPSWLDQKVIDSCFNCLTYERYSFENVHNYGFLSKNDLIKEIEKLYNNIIQRKLSFQTPLNSKEIDFIYTHLTKKIKLFSYLIALLPSHIGELILAKMAKIRISSAATLIKEFTDLEKAISPAWFLLYLIKFSVQSETIKNLVETIITQNLKGEQNPLLNQLNSILIFFYGIDDKLIIDGLQNLEKALQNGEPDSTILSDIASRIRSSHSLKQPKDSWDDKIQLFLHAYRWKIVRTEMAALPDGLSKTIHQAKYILSELSKKICIYSATPDEFEYQDSHVHPSAKLTVNEISKKFSTFNNPIAIFNHVKDAIINSKTEGFFNTTDVINWFKMNPPPEMPVEQFHTELYNEDYITPKDKWLIYFFEKTGIFVKRQPPQ